MQAHRAHQHAHRTHQIVHATAAYAFIAVGLASGYAIPAIVPACALLLPLLLHACWSTCAGRHAMLLPCRPLNMSSSQGRDARACKW